jgi:hypothetical protein
MERVCFLRNNDYQVQCLLVSLSRSERVKDIFNLFYGG